MNTSEKILTTALELFSRRGFSAVSVRDIAAQIGVRESAMYKHFSGKQAVFDRLLDQYMQASAAYMSGIHALPNHDRGSLAHAAAFYGRLSNEEFIRIGCSVFTDFLMLPDILMFWRMISIERMNHNRLAQLWSHHLFEEPIVWQTSLFSLLIHKGHLKPVDPAMLALAFYTPLLTLYINALPFDPDGPEFANMLAYANQHMTHFKKTYERDKEEEHDEDHSHTQ